MREHAHRCTWTPGELQSTSCLSDVIMTSLLMYLCIYVFMVRSHYVDTDIHLLNAMCYHTVQGDASYKKSMRGLAGSIVQLIERLVWYSKHKAPYSAQNQAG